MEQEKKEFKTRTDFLLDMLEYYCPDPTNRRAWDEEKQMCVYEPIGESEGCAIGRHLPLEVTKNLEGVVAYVISTNKEDIPDWMLALGEDFLMDVQSLHDGRDNWAETGLSDDGKELLRYIVSQFIGDMEPFNKFIS